MTEMSNFQTSAVTSLERALAAADASDLAHTLQVPHPHPGAHAPCLA